jgi:DNA-binding MarR family transcriptional regulator
MLKRKDPPEPPQAAGSVDLAALPGYLGYMLRQAQAGVFRDFKPLMGDLGIRPGEFSLLTLVAANPGIHQGVLARFYRLDKSTLSASIKSLLERGLIARTRNPDDRRYYALQLTDTGRKALSLATRRVEQQERKMDSMLAPGERAQLLDLLRRIAGVFD